MAENQTGYLRGVVIGIYFGTAPTLRGRGY
jgi:hypothetical protein